MKGDTSSFIASKLDRPKRLSGSSWMACCPAHEDREPSLHLSDSDDGTLLVHCLAGCEQRAVIDALKARVLWPERKQTGNNMTSWRYEYAEGSHAFDIVRFPSKKIRPRLPDGTWKALSPPRPLYGLPAIIASLKPVLVVEGEKTADAARRIFPDHVVTTSSGGSKAARMTDWKPLSGRDVTIWPDADQAGKSYAKSVRKILRRHKTAARIIALPDDLPTGWDLADRPPTGVDLQALIVNSDKRQIITSKNRAAMSGAFDTLKCQAP